MITGIVKGLFLGLALFCGNAFAAFEGDYDIANWTQAPGTGSIDTTGAPNSVDLISGDDGSGDPGFTLFSIMIVGDGTLSFDWSYVTTDVDGPNWDPYGYDLNGTFTQLSNDAGPDSQSGSVGVAVTVGDSFSFEIRTLDNLFGAATTTISNFSAPAAVPLPPSAGLLGFAVAGLLVSRRREVVWPAHLRF